MRMLYLFWKHHLANKLPGSCKNKIKHKDKWESNNQAQEIVSLLFLMNKGETMGNNTNKIRVEDSIFESIGRETGRLVTEKNKKYGDAFAKSGDILRIYYPDGIKTDQYDDMLAMIRIIDKQFRIATDRDAFGESPWVDITGYGILAQKRDLDRRKLLQSRVDGK